MSVAQMLPDWMQTVINTLAERYKEAKVEGFLLHGLYYIAITFRVGDKIYWDGGIVFKSKKLLETNLSRFLKELDEAIIKEQAREGINVH